MSSNPEPSYVPHDTFAQSHLQILRQDKWCTSIRDRSLRQSKPVVISHRFFKQEQGSWPCASLKTAWCLSLKSMRKLEILSFLHCNKSLLYTVSFCKSPKASFICLVQHVEAPQFPREISAFITSRYCCLNQPSCSNIWQLTWTSKIARVPARILETHTSLQK